MKTLPVLLSAALFATAAALARVEAQEPASAFGLTPSAPSSPSPSSLLPEGSGGLIPEGLPSPEESKKAMKERKSKTTAAEDALRDRIKLRETKIQAKSDPALQALWDSRLTARSDYEQRAILTTYYTKLVERIGTIDKSLKKDQLDQMRAEYLGTFKQTRIAPTVPPESVR